MNLRYRMMHKPTDWAWICKHVNLHESSDNMGMVAIDTDTELPVAVMVLENLSENSAQTHFAVTNPMAFKHGFLEEACEFLFYGLKLDHVYGYVKSTNLAALSVDAKIGFKEVYLMKDAIEFGIDCHMLKMTREDCNYLKANDDGR